MTRTLTVVKTVSGGNDFLHVEGDPRERSAEDISNQVRRLCSRHCGMGADGLVFRTKTSRGSIQFRIFNRDGKEAELSGNGMAGCAAVLIQQHPELHHVELDTAVGSRMVTCLKNACPVFRFRVEIGPAEFTNQVHFPFLEKGRSHYSHQGLSFTPVSMGNPHAVSIVSGDIPDSECILQAHTLQNAPIFPEGINVEIVQPVAGDRFRVLFFERGVGRTRTSSTGSAAVFAVLNLNHMAGDSIQILTPGIPPLRALQMGASIAVENITRIVYKGEYVAHEETEENFM